MMFPYQIESPPIILSTILLCSTMTNLTSLAYLFFFCVFTAISSYEAIQQVRAAAKITTAVLVGAPDNYTANFTHALPTLVVQSTTMKISSLE